MYFFVSKLGKKQVLGEEAAHLFSMRVKTGDKILVTNLQGKLLKVEIIKTEKKEKLVKWKVLEEIEKNNFNNNVLFQSIVDKIYLDKLVELLPLGGISEVFLFSSDNSPKQNLRLDRLEKILIRSCEQSENIWKPEIEIIEKDELEKMILEHKPVLLDCASGGECERLFEENENSNLVLSALVGPEGGWSKKERAWFEKLGLKKASLGEIVCPSWLAGYSYFIQEKKTSSYNKKLKDLGWNFELDNS